MIPTEIFGINIWFIIGAILLYNGFVFGFNTIKKIIMFIIALQVVRFVLGLLGFAGFGLFF